jgi:hypothetical protein
MRVTVAGIDNDMSLGLRSEIVNAFDESARNGRLGMSLAMLQAEEETSRGRLVCCRYGVQDLLSAPLGESYSKD